MMIQSVGMSSDKVVNREGMYFMHKKVVANTIFSEGTISDFFDWVWDEIKSVVQSSGFLPAAFLALMIFFLSAQNSDGEVISLEEELEIPDDLTALAEGSLEVFQGVASSLAMMSAIFSMGNQMNIFFMLLAAMASGVAGYPSSVLKVWFRCC